MHGCRSGATAPSVASRWRGSSSGSRESSRSRYQRQFRQRRMSLSYLDADGEQVEIPLSEVEAKCEDGILVDDTQVSRMAVCSR